MSPDDARARSVMCPVEPDPIASMPWVKGCARPADMNRRSFVRPGGQASVERGLVSGSGKPVSPNTRATTGRNNPRPPGHCRSSETTPHAVIDRRGDASQFRGARGCGEVSAALVDQRVADRGEVVSHTWGPVTSSHSTSAECWHCPVRQMCDEYWRSAFVDRDPGGDRYRSVQHPSGRVGSAERPFGGWSAFLLGGVR